MPNGETGSGIRALDVGGRRIGPGEPCLVIGEVALAHDGSLGMAHAFIDAIARAGADCVKFQTHIASAESTAREPFRVAFSRQDATRYDYWVRTGFTAEQWAGLAGHTRDAGMIFLSSPFSERAIELLDLIGTPAWKIGSGEVGNEPLLRRAAATGKPVLLSSGLSSLSELDRAVQVVRESGAPVAVLQCTSEYPCPPERLGLEQIARFSKRYGCPAGLSDHSGTIFAGLGAVMLGASIIEVHVTLSREMFGPDVVASLTTAELGELVRGVRFLERTLASPIEKEQLTPLTEEFRRIFTKSLVARRQLVAGTIISREDVAAKKPGTGIPPARLEEVVGRRLRRDIDEDDLLSFEDLDLDEA